MYTGNVYIYIFLKIGLNKSNLSLSLSHNTNYLVIFFFSVNSCIIFFSFFVLGDTFILFYRKLDPVFNLLNYLYFLNENSHFTVKNSYLKKCLFD